MLRLALPLCLLAACRGIHAQDVAARFAGDFAAARLRMPTQEDLAPARVEGEAMQGTVRLAREYLEQGGGDSMYGRYVRALLASAHLMRGETGAAREVMAGLGPYRKEVLSEQNAFTTAVVHAVSACRAVEARMALDRMFERRLGIDEFVRRYGSFVGIALPDRAAACYTTAVGHHAQILRASCLSEVAGDPRAMERVSEGRTDLHRLASEQIYNDGAAMMAALPRGRSAEAEWLDFLAVALVKVYAEVFSEIVPMSLSADQRHWQVEQVTGVFMRAEAAVERLKARGSHAIYATLPGQLEYAEAEIIGWIQTR